MGAVVRTIRDGYRENSRVRKGFRAMTNYLETRMSEIADFDFQKLIDELCFCVDLPRDDFHDQRLSFLLMAIGREGRTLSAQHTAMPGILTTSVHKLSHDSAVFQVCNQLAAVNRTNIESFDGKTVLSLIKKCSKIYSRELARAKKARRKV